MVQSISYSMLMALHLPAGLRSFKQGLRVQLVLEWFCFLQCQWGLHLLGRLRSGPVAYECDDAETFKASFACAHVLRHV